MTILSVSILLLSFAANIQKFFEYESEVKLYLTYLGLGHWISLIKDQEGSHGFKGTREEGGVDSDVTPSRIPSTLSRG